LDCRSAIQVKRVEIRAEFFPAAEGILLPFMRLRVEMIKCVDLKKVYSEGKNQVIALNGISLSVEKGEFVAIQGKSGCGKSTLLNMLGLIDKPTSGDILFEGNSILSLSEKEKARFRNKRIGYIFQSFYLDSAYSAIRNVEIPIVISGIQKENRRQMVEEALKAVGMESRGKTPAGALSGGEKQRICIARALVNNPDIILADEPCGSLDSQNTKQVMDILSRIHETGVTILMVTHSEEDAKYASRRFFMEDGRITEG
jgi:putative ABC transport system ATP-binding protein